METTEWEVELEPVYEYELDDDVGVEWGESEYIQVTERSAPRYEGPYEVTPSTETQTLDTDGMVMTGKLTVNPIPRNWGLISWNGAVLTVS